MLKPQYVMAKNRFPGAIVHTDEHGVSVYSKSGELLAACRKDGSGRVVDVQEDLGAKFPFSSEPIPQNARVHKHGKDGKVTLDEQHAERRPVAAALAAKFDGRVPSIRELKEAGYELKHAPKEEHKAEVVLKQEAPKQEAPKQEAPSPQS